MWAVGAWQLGAGGFCGVQCKVPAGSVGMAAVPPFNCCGSEGRNTSLSHKYALTVIVSNIIR